MNFDSQFMICESFFLTSEENLLVNQTFPLFHIFASYKKFSPKNRKKLLLKSVDFQQKIWNCNYF